MFVVNGKSGNLLCRISACGLFAFLFHTLVMSMLAQPSFAARADLNKGKKLFQDMQCAICHTDGGNNLNPERPLKGPAFLKRFPADDNKELDKIIRVGIPAKGMPAFGKDKLSDKDLCDLVAYIRSLTPPAKKKSK